MLAVACLLAALGLIAPGPAAAAGPNVELSVEQPAQALLGTQQEVTLRASNPKGEARAYNLTFRAVLPKGVRYVGPARGSDGSSLEPRVLDDAPNEGETTLIFANVADLSGNSHYAVTFKVEATSPEYTIGGTYTDEAGAYVNEEARLVPKFGADGSPEPGSFTGSAEAAASTTLTAVEIKKSEPSPEQELLRGVHEHQTVYTLKLVNNEVGPTKELVVDDYLPAGLEFLGCGGTDHTTEAPTNPGSAEEYPGAGAIFPGNDPAAPQCREPSSVATEEVDPPGPQTKGVYTHVRWTGLGELAPGQELKLQYRAAIPIRANTMTWPHGMPDPTELDQAANLDNNSGAETFDEEPLTNVATVGGKYQGTVATEDSDEHTVYAEDLAVQKSVDKATIAAGQLSEWTLKLETSEYRYSNGIEIEDVLPNGLCPLGKEENYEGPTIGSPTDPEPECINSGGALPTSEYSSVEEQPNGSFVVKWDETTVKALEQMAPSSTFQITFPTHTRVDYQKNFEPEKPVLTGDRWSNRVEIEGDSFARCTPKADDTCEGGGTHIAADRPEGERIVDASAAEQVAGGVTIDKSVRENTGAVPVDCSGTYVDGVEKPFPLYGPGDQICWKLEVHFNADLFSGEPVVTDFLPPEQRYVENSIVEGLGNTVSALPETGEAANGVIKWTINGGKAVESAKVFEFLFKTEMLTSASAFPQDVTGNLMKFSYANSEGETFPLRDRAEVERREPQLSLEKSIVEVVGGGSFPKTPPGGKSSVVVGGGKTVKYELDLENAGNLGAEEVEVWDVLPEGIDCGDVNLPAQTAPQAAECVKDTIKWTGVAVPIGALTTLTYEVTVPTEVAPGHAFVNHAGVTRFKSPTNTGEKFEYVPAENIDPELTKTNTGPLLDEAELKTTAATLEKGAVTETEQPGNGPGQATIGELIDYTVTAKIPANSKLYGTPVLKDELPAGLAKVGLAAAELDGASLPAGMTLEQLTNGAEVKFGGPYPETAGAQEHTLVLTFKARVRNVAANKRGVTITNHASFEFKDVEEAEPTVLKKALGTSVVEPRLEVKKHLRPEGRSAIVAPGEIVEYETEVSNLPGSSTANEVTVTDTVPAGMNVVDAGPKGTAAGNTITWHLETIAPGETEHLVYKLEVVKPASAASSFTNVVKGETQSLPDEAGGVVPPETRQASFKEGTYEAAKAGYKSGAENTVRLIGATVSKEVSPTKGTIGSELTYTLHMNLPGEIKYFNTTLVDRLPDGVTFDEFAGSECKGEGCNLGEELGVEVQPDGTTLIGWYFGHFEAGAPRELVLRFTAHVDDVKVGSGAEVKAPEALVNQVVGVYNETEGTKPTTVPVPGSKSFSEETNVGEATTTVAEPKVTLAKSVTAEPALVGTAVQPGSTLTYSLTVANTGGWNAYEVEVLDTNTTANLLDVTPVAGSGFVKSSAGEPLLWVVPEIEAGKSVTLTYTAELPPSSELQGGEAIDNAAEVPSYFGLPEPERGKAGASREYAGPQAAKDLEVALPQIRVEKTTGEAGSPEEATAEVGKRFPWRVVVENESPVAGAKAVGVEDLLPSNWEYVAGSTVFQALGGATVAEPAFDPTVTGTETQTLSWANVATALPPGAAVEVRFEATPTVAALGNPEGLHQENSAVGSFHDRTGASGSEDGPYSGEDEAFANLLEPKLEIEKTPDGAETVAGSNDKYEIVVSNSGTGAAHEVEVTDVLSEGQEFLGPASASPSTGFAQKSVEANTPGTGETTVAWTIVEVPVGGTVTITVPIKTLPSLDDGDEVSDVATASSPQQVDKPSDPGSFEVHRETELTIEKTAVQEEVNAGEEIEYELKVENKGPSDATGVVVTDELPEHTAFKSADPECAEAGGTVTCELAEMKVGEAHTFHVTVEVESGTTGSIENTAKVRGDQPEPPGGGPTESSVVTPIGGLADLAIEKTGPREPVLLGSEFTYEIKVRNDGPSDAVNATVEDELPSQVRFLAATTSVGTCDEAPAALLTCDLGRMLPHAEATIVVSVEAAEVGGFTNVATVDSDTSPEPKEGEAPAEIVPAADLAITKTAPAKVAPDGALTYALHVENHGPSVAHKVKVTDPLPAGVDFVSASEGCGAAGGTVTCEAAGDLAVGDSVDFEVTVHVPFALGGQALTNTATVAAEEADPHVEDNSSTVTTDVGPVADLAITKTMGRAEAGKPLTYTLAVTNHGPSAASAVTVTDSLPAGTSFKSAAPSQGTCSASGQAVTCGLGPLAAGGSAQVSITVEVAATATGSLRNVATVEGPEPDPDKSNNESAVEGPIKPADPAAPNLKVVKSADTSSPAIGAPFTYRVDITNVSGGEAKNVKVVDTLTGPVKVVSIDAGAGHCGAAGSKITCSIPRIPVGETVHVTYSVVAEAAGSLKNTVSALAANGEKVPANNHAVKAVHVKDPPATYSLTKTASRKVVAGGKKVGFTITLRNGVAALVKAKVCDRLPATLVFVKAPGARYVNGEACWTKNYVAAHKVVRLHLVARAVMGYKSRRARNHATAQAANAVRRAAAATVRIKPAFAGEPGGVTG